MNSRLIVSMLLLAVAAFAQEGKPDFSGMWKMNAAQSDFGPLPPSDTRTDTITHKDPAFKEAVNASDQQYEATYTTDGKESKNTVMGYDMISTAKWDGTALVIESKLDLGGSTIVLHGTLTLSADGKVLTRKTHISGMMEGDQTLVFDKQ